MATGTLRAPLVDERAVAALAEASTEVATAWRVLQGAAACALPHMGLSAGDRPGADVEVLASALASAEHELARRMHAAHTSGSLPLQGPGALLLARGWGSPWSRRLVRAGALAHLHPALDEAWSAGLITSDHVDAIARAGERLTDDERSAVIAELAPLWGQLSPAAVSRFVAGVVRMLHPPGDPERGELDAHESRDLSSAVLGDTVLLSASLPRVEGELVMAAIEAFAERLRTQADDVPAGARRADALVELVSAAHAKGSVPSRGGLPVSVTVTLDRTAAGDVVCTTSRGHQLTSAETRWACCDASVTPVLTGGGGTDQSTRCSSGAPTASPPSATERISALAVTLLGRPQPLAVGRTQRTATAGQRRALAVRDGGCIIPGCEIRAEACQTHHLREWAEGGSTDTDNMTLLCWTHHRQVDLGMWEIHPSSAAPSQRPDGGAVPRPPSSAGWPASNGAPFRVVRRPRSSWRL